MITAEIAFQNADKVKYCVDSFIESLDDLITKASDNGEFYLEYMLSDSSDRNVLNRVMDKLQDRPLNFKVKICIRERGQGFPDEQYFYISWEHIRKVEKSNGNE